MIKLNWIVILVIIALLVLLYINNSEHFAGALTTQNAEAVANISSMVNSGNLKVTNLEVSGLASFPGARTTPAGTGDMRSHFPNSDGNNYIRGNTFLNGTLFVDKINIGGIVIEKDNKGQLAFSGKIRPNGVRIPKCNLLEFEKKNDGYIGFWSSCDGVTDNVAIHSYGPTGVWDKYYWSLPDVNSSIKHGEDITIRSRRTGFMLQDRESDRVGVFGGPHRGPFEQLAIEKCTEEMDSGNPWKPRTCANWNK